MPRIRVAAAQLDLVVGDLAGNEARILDAYERASRGRRRPRRVPRARDHGLPAGGPAPAPGLRRAGGGDPREDRGAHRTTAAVVGFPESIGGGRLANAAALSRTARCRGSTASTCSRTTPSSTSSGTSSRSPTTARCSPSPACRSRSLCARTPGRADGPIITQAAAGAEVVVNINASPYSAGRVREREQMLADRAPEAEAADRLREPRRRPGRARLRRRVDGHRRRRLSSSRARRSSPRTCSSSTSTSAGRIIGARLPIRDAGGAARRPSRSARAISASAATASAHRAAPRRGARGVRRARPRHARLHGEERLHARPPRPVGRHRLLARRGDRRRRARSRAGHRRADAVAVLERPQRHRRRGARGEPRHQEPHDPDRARTPRLHRHARGDVPRARAGARRGEPAGPHPRARS